MADMVELANSNGDTVTDSGPGENKVNGELNGSCNNKDESLMDVDDDSSGPLAATTVTKKVVNNEIVNNTVETPQEDIEEAEEATEEEEEEEEVDDESSQDTAEEEKEEEESEEVNGNVDKTEDKEVEEEQVDNLEANKQVEDDQEEEDDDEPEQMEVDEENSLQEEDEEDSQPEDKEEEGASDTEEGTAADPLAGAAEDAMSQESEDAQNTDENVDDADEVEVEKEEKSEESKEEEEEGENDAEEDKKEVDEAEKEGEKCASDVANGGGDSDVMEVDSGDKKLNGSSSNATSEDASDPADASGDADTITAASSEVTPAKKNKKAAPVAPLNLTPRRSSRNLNKSKSYTEKDEKDIELIDDRPNRKKMYDDDIQEISAVDPLADTSSASISMKQKLPRPIVISDTKRLVEISQQQQQQAHGGQHHLPHHHHNKHNQVSISKAMPKKEPTLVIIDTNSILSGRGPVPIAHSTPTTSISLNRSPQLTMLPVHKSQPVLMNNKPGLLNIQQKAASPAAAAVSAQPPPILLPSLTDDMFVVEAPSFIVPYVYEKPPVKPLKEFVEDLDKTIKKEKEEKEKEKKKEDEKKKKEGDEEEKKSDEDEEMTEDKNKKAEDKKDKDEVKDEKEADKAEAESKLKEEEEETKKKNDKDEVIDVTKTSATDKDKPEDTKEEKKDEEEDKSKKSSGTTSYFENPLGKFFMHIGINLVQEHVQSDLLKSQKRKREREGTKVSTDTLQAIDSLTKTLEFSKENNDPFRFDAKKCEYCNFKTESKLVMAHHLETPHMKNYIYRCNFCPLEVRSPHDIMFHMEAEHNVRGRLEKAPAFHQCPSCLFEDNQKGKLTRHLLSCAKKYRPERNQEPPLDWEPPAKIPRVSRNRPNSMSPGNAVYHAAISGLKQGVGGNQQSPQTVLPKMMHMAQSNAAAAAAMSQALMNRQRGRPLGANTTPGLLYRPQGPNAQNSLVLPPQYQIQAGQVFHQPNKGVGSMANSVQQQQQQQQQQQANKLLNQPSISITPLPRQQPASSNASPLPAHAKPGRPQQTGGGKNTFVICEICDGYIKDLEQLRNHMQWIHKVKIHPKMIYNRPPLNCQKCQFRFFTDQGLERHLLGSHGLVTSSMQEAANKGKDGGRCPVCGRVYQWKLLNHVARDHNMQLKPAHLSYKCTVCTATFGMYRQFENHVYSAHSSVPKRPADKKPQTSSSSSNDSMRPLKINDEITIIPQPPRPAASSSVSSNKVKITPVPSKK